MRDWRLSRWSRGPVCARTGFAMPKKIVTPGHRNVWFAFVLLVGNRERHLGCWRAFHSAPRRAVAVELRARTGPSGARRRVAPGGAPVEHHPRLGAMNAAQHVPGAGGRHGAGRQERGAASAPSSPARARSRASPPGRLAVDNRVPEWYRSSCCWRGSRTFRARPCSMREIEARRHAFMSQHTTTLRNVASRRKAVKAS